MTEYFSPEEPEFNVQNHLEKELLKKEINFLRGRDKNLYIGVLTNSNIDVISSIYPSVADGLLRIYGFIDADAMDPLSPQGFLNRYVRGAYTSGQLLTNDEIEKLRDKLNNGDFSEQYKIHRRFREAASISQSANRQRDDKKRFEDFKPIGEDEDVIFNKRAVLARFEAIKSDIASIYGDVNYSAALLTEFVLASPFLTTLLHEGKKADLKDQHENYLTEAIDFCKKFNLENRIEIFNKETNKYPVKWTYEPAEYKVSEFDRQYIEKVYSTSKEMLEGKIELSDLYKLLSETILRRGKIFKASTVKTNFGSFVQIVPDELQPVSFDDIAGYKDQKRFFEVLLEKTKKADPSVDDIRIIISAGRPGLGKSVGVKAFLNSLPENAKGIVVSLDAESANRGSIPEYDAIMRVAKLHPDLHIFAVMEDIDAYAGDRLHFATTRKFLEVDSAVSDSSPKNFHLVATTNRPDVIDPAVTRPGRAAKILVYEEPDRDVRKGIVEVHANKNNYQLSNEMIDFIAEKTEGFTPDEIRHVIWTMRFEDVQNPTEEDMEKAIGEIVARHKIEQEASALAQKNQRI